MVFPCIIFSHFCWNESLSLTNVTEWHGQILTVDWDIIFSGTFLTSAHTFTPLFLWQYFPLEKQRSDSPWSSSRVCRRYHLPCTLLNGLCESPLEVPGAAFPARDLHDRGRYPWEFGIPGGCLIYEHCSYPFPVAEVNYSTCCHASMLIDSIVLLVKQNPSQREEGVAQPYSDVLENKYQQLLKWFSLGVVGSYFRNMSRKTI